jgi:hypothetical protein
MEREGVALLNRDIPRMDSEIVELSLLLPRWQIAALEKAARQRGLTTGQMLRQIIGAGLRQPATDSFAEIEL